MIQNSIFSYWHICSLFQVLIKTKDKALRRRRGAGQTVPRTRKFGVLCSSLKNKQLQHYFVPRNFFSFLKTAVLIQAKTSLLYDKSTSPEGGYFIGKNTGGWLDSLGSRILVGKIYFGVFKKIDLDSS